MSSFGVTTTGFVLKTTQDILDEVKTAEKSAYGSGVDVSADSVFGQLNGVFAGSLSSAWQGLQAVYSSMDPDVASGAALDRIAALTDSTRLPATQSTATVACTGTPGTFLPSGRVVLQSASDARFASTSTGTLIAAAAWAGTTAYALDDRVTNSGNIYQAIVAGTSAGAGGPTTTDFDTPEVDGTVTWRFLGVGTAVVDVPFEAEEFGPTAAAAGTLNNIDTPVGGWSDAANPEDAAEGRNLETDADFRIRRLIEINVQGDATLDAIRSDILRVDGVESAFVYENVSEFTDADGRPPNSIELVVGLEDPSDAAVKQAVTDALFDTKAAGIATFGFPGQIVTLITTDSQGTSHTVNYTLVAEVEIYIEIEVTANTDPTKGALYPLDGDALVKDALVDLGNTLTAGEDVIAEKIKCEAFKVPGVTDITAFFIDTSASPAISVNVPITDREIAVFDTSRVTVAS